MRPTRYQDHFCRSWGWSF